MQPRQWMLFPPFRLDVGNAELRQGDTLVPLRAKPLAVLCYLIENPGRVVSKRELVKAVWPHTYVSESVVRGHLRDLRMVLGDDAEHPRFIETVGRQGYRWIAPLRVASPATSEDQASSPLGTGTWEQTLSFVGREAELKQLHGWWHKAQQGERQMVFVTGEAGIGKTTLIDAFLAQVEAHGVVQSPTLANGNGQLATSLIGRGQCIEHFGVSEAYLPVLAALGQLCREADGPYLIDLFRRHAPTWLVQMPALLDGATLEALQHQVFSTTRERMLRELAEALEVLTAERSLILVLEDLHWSDTATLDFLAFLARRRQAARLLVIGIYRPVEVIVRAHPLREVKHELQMHAHCVELSLRPLDEAAVAKYLTLRFAGLHELTQVIHQRTEGNPLFMVNLVQDLVTQGVLREEAGHWQVQGRVTDITKKIPETLLHMIEKHLQGLSPEARQALMVASVQGYKFDVAVVARVLGADVAEVEERLAELERVHELVHLLGEEELPDRTLTLRYRFMHVLYQNSLYGSLTPTRKVQWSGAVAQALIGYYGEKSETVAVELAHLFKTARQYGQAAEYYLIAAQHAMQVFAYAEALTLARQGLEVLEPLPDSPQRQQQEIALQLSLGGALSATESSTSEMEAIYTRARELSQQTGDTRQLLLSLRGLAGFNLTRGKFHIARELGEQMLELAHRLQDAVALVSAHASLGGPLLYLGEFIAAREHFEQALAFYNPQQCRTLARFHGWDPSMLCLCETAHLLWLLGYAEQARERLHKALIAAQAEPSRTSNLVIALQFASGIHLQLREGQAAQKWAEEVLTLATEQGFPYAVVTGNIRRGWALVDQGQKEEGMAQLRQGVAAYWTMGIEGVKPFWLGVMAEACGKVGQTEEGLAAVAEALTVVGKTRECWCEAELYRVKGELSLQSRSPESGVQKAKGKNPHSVLRTPQLEAEAEECFHKAIEIARRQEAKFFELRVTMSLSRLWQCQGKKKEARKLLASVYGWFTEGFDTVDLKEAKTLLKELSH